jgi:hypothetical protein
MFQKPNPERRKPSKWRIEPENVPNTTQLYKNP